MKNYTNIREENEKVFQLKQIYNSKIEDYIEWYFDEDQSSDETFKDFDYDGITDNQSYINVEHPNVIETDQD